MKGDNPLLVAQEDGRSVETMLRTYAPWIKGGAKPEDIERIKTAMAGRPSTDGVSDEPRPFGPPKSPNLATSEANRGFGGTRHGGSDRGHSGSKWRFYWEKTCDVSEE